MTSYPLSLPASPVPARVTPRMQDAAALSASPFTAEQQAYLFAGSWWEADVTLPSMTAAQFAPWRAFLAALRGRFGTFTMGFATGRTPLGVATGTPLVAGGGQSGGVLATDGWSTGVTGILKAGDYIQIGGRLHMLLADANSDGSGVASLNIWPDLRSAPADNLALIVNNTVGLWRLAANARPWDETPGPIYDLSFSCSEAL